jgi:PAS domain S-box-containing protein
MCEQILGIKASDAIGKSSADFITMVENYPGHNLDRINLLLEKGFNREEQLYRTPRGEIWVDVQAQEMKKDGKRYGWITLISDISERKKTEEAIKQSEEKYRSLIDTSPDAIISADSRMNIIIWNRSAEKIFGYTQAEMVGQSTLKMFPEASQIGIANWYSEFDKTGVVTMGNQLFEATGLKKDRSEFPIEVSISTRKSGATLIATAVIRDISIRKEAQEALKQSEEKFRELINTSNDGIVSIDPQMRFIIWNQGAEILLGYTEKEMLGLSVLTIFPTASQKDVARELVQLKNTGISGTINRLFETYVMKKDCSLTPVDISISARKTDDGYISTAIMRDITIRKEAEKRIRESEERYRDLFENASDLIQSCNIEGKFIYVNKAWRDALGYGEKEVTDLIIWDIIHPDFLARCKQTFQIVMSGETVNNIETVFVTKDGRAFQVEGNVNPVHKEEKVVATRAIFHDITSRKEAEEKLRKIDQMKSEFLSNVSHELRTPLQSISGFTKLIMNGQVEDTKTQQEFFQIIDRETMHLGNLINGLLDMSRLEVGRFQIYKTLIQVSDTLTDPIKMFRSLAHEKDITLTENVATDLPEMGIDAERIRQVIINLVGNAIKFSDPGSKVDINVTLQPNELLFQVSDHGIGISEQSMKHLFERFYRAEGETVRGGTGLGLYISKQIIDAHGGRIWAESKFGEGSTFSFTLPLDNKGGNGNDKENSGH